MFGAQQYWASEVPHQYVPVAKFVEHFRRSPPGQVFWGYHGRGHVWEGLVCTSECAFTFKILRGGGFILRMTYLNLTTNKFVGLDHLVVTPFDRGGK